jgi:DNA-binding LacI/PurR family transcriptional regulator
VKRVTIKDVANLAGVDVSTVSRVINQRPRIADATRVRVQQAIVQLDYRPNVAARAMVTDRTRTFALLVPNLADPNVAAIAAGAEGRARHEGYSMVVAAYSAHAPEEGDPDSFFREHRVDGLLLMSPRHYPSDAPDLPTATLEEAPVDNADGGRQVGALLRRLGHERVVYLGGPQASPHVRERLRGLAEVVGAPATVAFGDWKPQSGFALANRWLDGDRDATAIFAAGDLVALGVLHALHARGVRVPEDVSVVGFDDTAIAAHTWPRLTTVSQPLAEVGAAAFGTLLDRIEGRAPRPSPTLPVWLVVRDSTGPAPRP